MWRMIADVQKSLDSGWGPRLLSGGKSYMYCRKIPWLAYYTKYFCTLLFFVIITVYTTDMILSEVHLCIMSAVLMRTVFGIGSASIHTPSLRCTCSTMFIQLYTVSRKKTLMHWTSVSWLWPVTFYEIHFYKISHRSRFTSVFCKILNNT